MRKPHFFQFSGLLLLLCLSPVTHAACKFVNGVTASVIRNVSFGTVTVQRDTPAGTVLSTRTTGAYNNGRTIAGCDTSWVYQWSNSRFNTLSRLGNKIYDTNIPGIGLRLSNTAASSTAYLPYETTFSANVYVLINKDGIKAELIKTSVGAVGSGNLSTGSLASASVKNQFYIAGITLTGTNRIVPVACSVTNTAITVPMGNVLSSSFSGVGSTAASQNFNIPLDCDAQTRVKITLDATRDSSGAAGVIALNSASTQDTAKGIGVQVLYRNNPVAFGSAISVGTVASTGTYNIPLTARYYQTSSPVQAGQANAVATFTMTYN